MLIPFLTLALAALLLISVMMVLVWLVSLRINNAGIVDVFWSWGFTPVALLYAVLAPGLLERKALMILMAASWSLRLGTYLFFRVKGHHPVEDARYHALKQEWGADANWKMLVFFLFQGVVLVLLTSPFLLASLNPAPKIGMLEWLGVGLWMIGIVGESLADAQLSGFKADTQNRGKTCQVGLWRYSRHPNYFFEWVIWMAFFTFAAGSPYGWITFFCPLLILHLLVNVTGIPMLEAQALKTKGEEYREYQRRTNAFFPWFQKK